MASKLLFAQLVIALVSGQSIEDSAEVSPAPSMQDLAAQVGLAQPTSSWITSSGTKTTSPAWMPSSASSVSQSVGTAPLALNVLNGAEGDTLGANPRNNMVYFGIGRHGFDIGAKCDGDCCGGSDCSECNGSSNCQQQSGGRQQSGCQNCGQGASNPQGGSSPSTPRGSPVPVGGPRGRGPVVPAGHAPGCNGNHGDTHDCYGRPYLKVTPSMVVKTSTRTEVGTSTVTSLDLHTFPRTRTITDEIRSTKTHVLKPEVTSTFIDRKTMYEYPASTIDAGFVRPAAPSPMPNYGNGDGCRHEDSNCDCRK